MPTAQQLIYTALRQVGMIRPGQGANAETMADALSYLNSMLDSWAAQRTLVYSIARNEFTTTPGKQVYTLGTGGDWNIARPTRIDRAGAILALSTYPVETPMGMLDSDGWADVRVKAITSATAYALYPDNSFPLNNISVWPIPTGAQPLKIALYTWQQLAQFANLAATYAMPPGYEQALRLSLAELLWPIFFNNRKLTRDQGMFEIIQRLAQNARSVITAINSPRNELTCPQIGGGGWFDVRSNGYIR